MIDAQVSIRRARAADVAALVPLFEAYREFYRQPAQAERSRAYLMERLSREEAVVFIAWRAAQALGFTLLYPLFSSTRLCSVWLLNDLYVAPHARRSGIGASLLQQARDFARRNGAASLTLRTALDNTTAQQLYEAEGYVRNTAFYTYDLAL